MNRQQLTLQLAAVTLSLAALAPLPAIAQTTVTWDGGGADGYWLTATNWVGDVSPSAGDALVFAGTARQVNTNNFAANTIFDSITFSPTGGFTLRGNAVQLSSSGNDISSTNTANEIAVPLSAASGGLTYSHEGTGLLTLSGVISGAGGLTKDGNGSSRISAACTYTGDTTLLNNNIRLGVANALPTATVLRFGATANSRRLQLQGFNQTLGGADSTAATGGNLILEAASDGQNNSAATLTLNVASGSNYTFSGYVRNAAGGAVNSALSVTKTGAGTQVFSGQGSIVSYSGATTINGGILEFSGTNSVANNSAIMLSGGSVKFSGGGNRTRTIGGVAGSLIKAGDNTLTLGGTNTYAGSTVVEAGTLKLGTGVAVSNSVGFTMNGGVLDLNGFAVTNAVLESSVAGPGGVVSNGTLAVTTTVTPGGSNTVGSVTLPNAPDLSGTLWVDVTSGGACDQLKVTGSLSVDKLNLRVVDTNLLDKASTYTIVQCTGGTAAGPFLSDNLPSAWKTSYQGDRIVILIRRGTLIRVL